MTLVSDGNLPWRLLIVIVLIAGLIRGAVCFASLSHFSEDPDGYRAIAETLAATGVYGLTDAQGQGRPTAYRPPLYPYLLSLITVDGRLGQYAVAAIHTLLGTISVAMVFVTSRRLLGDRWRPMVGLVAAMLVTIDPILVRQSTFVMTETLATTLVCAVLFCASRKGDSGELGRAAWIGLWLGLAYLCRPTFLVWAGLLCLIWLAVPVRVGGIIEWRRTLVPVATVAILVLSALGLWTLRNQREIGDPVWATTHGGYTLLLGNNPFFYDYLREGEFGVTWDPDPFFRAFAHRYEGDPTSEAFWNVDWSGKPTVHVDVTESEDDRVAYHAARATIDREPGMFAWSCLVRLGRLWSPVPHRTGDRSWLSVAGIGLFFVLSYLAVLVGGFRVGPDLWGRRWWPIWTLVVALSMVHAVYWSNLRMRAPVVPGLAIVAAAACVRPTEPVQ